MEDNNAFIEIVLIHLMEQFGGSISIDANILKSKLDKQEFKAIAVSTEHDVIRLELVDEDKSKETA